MIHGTWNWSMSPRIKNVRDGWAGWLFHYAFHAPLSSVLGPKNPDMAAAFLMSSNRPLLWFKVNISGFRFDLNNSSYT